jgi:hypothetical protein
MVNCENAFSVREFFQRHFVNGANLPTVAKTGVVHYSSVPHVNAVMRVNRPVSDHMSAGRKWRANSHVQRIGCHMLPRISARCSRHRSQAARLRTISRKLLNCWCIRESLLERLSKV